MIDHTVGPDDEPIERYRTFLEQHRACDEKQETEKQEIWLIGHTELRRAKDDERAVGIELVASLTCPRCHATDIFRFGERDCSRFMWRLLTDSWARKNLYEGRFVH
jgi:hypothetical protein